jgi:hypothetical protein
MSVIQKEKAVSIKMGIVAAAAALVAAHAPPAHAASNWSHQINRPVAAKRLGLPADAGPVRLGRAAVERKIGVRLGASYGASSTCSSRVRRSCRSAGRWCRSRAPT